MAVLYISSGSMIMLHGHLQVAHSGVQPLGRACYFRFSDALHVALGARACSL